MPHTDKSNEESKSKRLMRLGKNVFKQTRTHLFIQQDAKNGLASQQNVGAVITSPPYFRCRDYTPGIGASIGMHVLSTRTTSVQIGHEDDPFTYARNLADVFGNANYLVKNGTIWIVIGDTIAKKNYRDPTNIQPPIYKGEFIGIDGLVVSEMRRRGFALHQELIWSKPSIAPSGASQKRCNPSHEYILIFYKRTDKHPRFNTQDIREASKTPAGTKMPKVGGNKYGSANKEIVSDGKRCRRSVWEICPSRSKHAHVAPFPEELARIAILASTDIGEKVVDPFGGTFTTAIVSDKLDRDSVCFDIYDHLNVFEEAPSSRDQ